MLGVHVDGPSWMFGDNMSVVMSSTIPSSTLKKRWNALSYHRVREAVASGIINVIHLSGDENPADVLTKIMPHAKSYYLMKPFLFWSPKNSEQDEGSVKVKQKEAQGNSESRGQNGKVMGSGGGSVVSPGSGGNIPNSAPIRGD